LNELKGKKEWKWEEEHQKVFEELKEKLQVNWSFLYQKERENSE